MKGPRRFSVFALSCVGFLYFISLGDVYWNKNTKSSQNAEILVDSRYLHPKIYLDEYCIFYDFLEANQTFREDGLEPITLVIHGTSDMLELVEKKHKNWDGPISFGLFLDYHSQNALEYISEVHRCVAGVRKKVTVHFAFRLSPFQTTCPTIMVPVSNITCKDFLKNQTNARESIAGPFQLYPSNVLRNVARRGAKSDLHFIADADMIMSEGFALQTKKIANEMLDGKNKKVLVVRRFETNGTYIPRNHLELREMVVNKTVFPFHHKFFFEGHKIENLTHWFNTTENLGNISSWQIPYASCYWEVQVILHRNDLYNADYFPARIKVMQSLIYSLCRADYTFHLLSHVFDVHMGIKLDDTIYSKAVIAHGRKYYRKQAHDRFRKDLNATYPNTFEKCGDFVM